MKRSKSFLDRHLNAVAILVLLAVSSFLGVFVLPVFASGPTVNNRAGTDVTAFTSITTVSIGPLTVSNTGDVLIVEFPIFFNIDSVLGGACPCDPVTSITDTQGLVWTQQVSTGPIATSYSSSLNTNCHLDNCQMSEMWTATTISAAATTIVVHFQSSKIEGAFGAEDAQGITAIPVSSAICYLAPNCGTYSTTTGHPSTTTTNNLATSELLVSAIGTQSGSFCAGGGSQTLIVDSTASPNWSTITGQINPAGNTNGVQGCDVYGFTSSAVTGFAYPWNTAAGGTFGRFALIGAIFSCCGSLLDVTILNLDLGNYMVVPYNKFYNFNETAIGVHGSNVNIVKWKWTDGLSTAEVQYSNVTKVATVLQGNNIITIGAPTATSSLVGGQRKLQVIIPVRPSENILDTTGVSINAYSQLADGTTRGYLVVRAKYFNIFNQGGTASSQISGNCVPSPILSGYFSALCQDPGWLMTNTTWFQLQSYHTEFAINLNDASGVPDVFLFQDFGNSNGGAEHYTAKGDWKVDVGWFYFNNGAWTKAFHVTLQMFKGNQGVQDQWTLVNALFYNGKNTLISNQTFNAWIEQNPRSQIRLYVDLWISKLNGSSLHAMRVGAYYYAIHQSGFTFFGTWSPFLQNASSAMAFAKNIDAGGKNIPAGQISFEKLYWNISRSHHPIGQANFQLFTRDYNLEQFKTTKGPMAGVDTPIFVDAKIPTLPVDGFFAPLYAAIASIGDFIWGALAAAFSAIWVAIGSRFPWFTGFWDTIGGNVTNFATLFISVLGYLGGFLSFLVSIFTFVTTPIQIVINAWNFLSSAFNTVLPGASAGQFATIFIIFTFGISLLEALFTGDWPWIIKFARQTWAIVNAIMFYAFKFARILIDAVLAIIP